jgi:quercetin dioxygenase-like cupin family protein
VVIQVERLGEGRGRELVRGVRMWPLFGEGLMLNLIEFEPRARVEIHSHPHEQAGLMLEGELVLEIDGVQHRLRPGDAYAIPGGVEHGAWTEGGGCRVLDVFHPPREDYRPPDAGA